MSGSAWEPTLFGDAPDMGPGPLPVLPYPDSPATRTSGWSGSDTSHERALADDASGRTTERQQQVLRSLLAAGPDGLTWRELAARQQWHHGQASGALSNLHSAGHIARLAEERRHRCAVYVAPRYVDGRPTSAPGYRARRALSDALAVVLEGHAPVYLPEAGGDVGCSCGGASGDYVDHLLEVVDRDD